LAFRGPNGVIRGWSQEQLATRAGISRAAVSAVEIERLVPSVAAALALASALDCRVEDLFGTASSENSLDWAWMPAHDPCRFWCARAGGRPRLFPAETTAAGILPHDGVVHHGDLKWNCSPRPDHTLVMASCDPAASLLAHEFTAASSFRLVIFQRSSGQALEMLRDGLVDVAGIHLTSNAANGRAAKSVLGAGYTLLHAASWQEGLAIGAGVSGASVAALARSRLRWVGREPGSSARECQDELLGNRPQPRKIATNHRGVAEAVRCGWADLGVCIRLVCEEAGLRFLKVRDEAYDLCFSSRLSEDPRLRALLEVVRSPSYGKWLADLSGYSIDRVVGDTLAID
jgi:molybdate-binding protein/transcriptional regulator with XRE-family HTH domain